MIWLDFRAEKLLDFKPEFTILTFNWIENTEYPETLIDKTQKLLELAA